MFKEIVVTLHVEKDKGGALVLELGMPESSFALSSGEQVMKYNVTLDRLPQFAQSLQQINDCYAAHIRLMDVPQS